MQPNFNQPNRIRQTKGKVRLSSPKSVPNSIQNNMEIEKEVGSELANLEMETRPEDVLAEIERLQRRVCSCRKPIS